MRRAIISGAVTVDMVGTQCKNVFVEMIAQDLLGVCIDYPYSVVSFGRRLLRQGTSSQPRVYHDTIM